MVSPCSFSFSSFSRSLTSTFKLSLKEGPFICVQRFLTLLEGLVYLKTQFAGIERLDSSPISVERIT